MWALLHSTLYFSTLSSINSSYVKAQTLIHSVNTFYYIKYTSVKSQVQFMAAVKATSTRDKDYGVAIGVPGV